MNLLIRNATIYQNGNALDGKKQDILIKNGVIEKIGNNIHAPEAAIVESPNLCCSAGWVDVGTQIGEPGFEHREDIQSVSVAAAYGGYSHILAFPNTAPAIDHASQVERLVTKTENNLVSIKPIGAISKDLKGTDLAEILDMHSAGAIAFSDGSKPIQDSRLMMRALEYVKPFDGIVIHRPTDTKLANEGIIHEGPASVSLGLKGIPKLAETNTIHRDLGIREYTDSRLFLHLLSTSDGLKYIVNARKISDKIYSSVSFLNLIYSEESLLSFDSNLKLSPPLRSKSDKTSLIKAVINGDIDHISSNHTPQELENKKLEFPYASDGAIGLQTTFAALNTYVPEISTGRFVDCVSEAPRRIFDLNSGLIAENKPADITLFDPSVDWTYTDSLRKSKSSNSPFLYKKLKGKVLGVVNNGKYALI